MKNLNLKGITKESLIGVALLVLSLVNAILQMFGFNTLPISNNQISEIVSTLFLIIMTLYNTYKNRNVTKASQKAQEVTDAIKNGEILIEDIDKILADLKK
jgi:SPP1 family holin